MRLGHVEQYGTPEEVYSRPETKYVARFIGSPQIDFLSGEFIRRADAQFYQVGTACIPLPADARLPERPVDLAVRAEHIILGKTGFPATVRLVQPVGPFTYVTVAWEGGALTARVSGLSRLRPKDPVQVEIDPSGIMFFDRGSEDRLEFAL